MWKIKILSKKPESITCSYDHIVIKYVNKELFFKLNYFKNNLYIGDLLHFIKYKEYLNWKYLLYYPKYYTINFSIFERNIYLLWTILLKLNEYFIYKNKITLWYIHTDPQYTNFLLKNWKFFLIDLDTIKYDFIIFQPLYFFTKVLFDIDFDNKKLKFSFFKKIFNIFIEHSGNFFNDFKKIWFNWIYLLYIKELRKYNKNEYLSALYFLLKEKKEIKNYFESKWIK